MGELIAEAQIRVAVRGKIQAAREVADRREGKFLSTLRSPAMKEVLFEVRSAIEKVLDNLDRQGVSRFPALPINPSLSLPACRCLNELQISEFHCPQISVSGQRRVP